MKKLAGSRFRSISRNVMDPQPCCQGSNQFDEVEHYVIYLVVNFVATGSWIQESQISADPHVRPLHRAIVSVKKVFFLFSLLPEGYCTVQYITVLTTFSLSCR
jgi:hypothetical protein